MSEPAPYYKDEPVIIYITHAADGATFALDPLSRDYLRATLPREIHVWPRIFIAEETRGQLKQIEPTLQHQVVAFLTGVSPKLLQEKYNGVYFIDSRQGQEFWIANLDHPGGPESPRRASDLSTTGVQRS